MTSPDPDRETVLIWTPAGRDAALTADLLAADGLGSQVCADLPELCAALALGAGAVLLSEAVLTTRTLARLTALLSTQPPWSDLPILIFSATAPSQARSDRDRLRGLGNVSFLDRPVYVRSMLAAVQSAVRARRRQYVAKREIELRDQFLAMLGHELRNPLGAICVASDLLGQPEGDAHREKHLAVIQRQSRHLARLVDDLLDVARLTYGKVTLRLEPVPLAEVLRASFLSYESAARKQKLAYTLSIDDEQLLVSGDRDRIQQVFGNLLTNAIKYTPRGGSVHVQLAGIGSDAVVRVIDTGIGIEPDMLSSVFELFTQAETGLDRAQGGMGLGLTLVRSLVRLHGGSVEAFSQGEGRGSAFSVRLPLSTSDAATAASQPALPREPLAARRIVIVEDNDDLREMQQEILLHEGHDVRTATTGPEGVSTILEFMPDAAFIDLGLPGCDGFEVARRVRAASPSKVLLIAVSGYGQVQDRKLAHAAGFDGHLTKPVGLEDFVSSMARLPAG